MPTSSVLDATSYFDLTTARKLASAAELAYAGPQVIEQTVLGRWQAWHFRFLDVEATQCFVTADRDTILVCFRGTEAERTEDWLVDLDFDLVDGPLQGRVHEGFYDALSCVWQLLDEEVRQRQAERPRQLWVTGHSLGAALATLAVARWREAGRPVARLYTFGQPRTGDSRFARHFDFAFRASTFRIVNNLDIVTRTPPRALGYRHLGTFVYVNESGELSYDIDCWRQFLNRWQGTIETILDWGGQGVQDHSMRGYCQRIENVWRRRSAVPSRRPARFVRRTSPPGRLNDV